MRDKHQSRVATTTAITTRRFSSVGLLLALFVLWSFSYLVGPQPSSQRHHQLWLLQQAASQQQQKTKKISLPTSKKRGNLTDDDDGDGICNIGRPVFVLHVGLEKTGTTFLQNTLCSNGMTEFLEQDDYEFLGVHCRHSLLYSVYKGIFTEDESSNNSASSNSSGQKKKKNQQQPQARSNHSMFYNFKHDEENDDSNLPTTSLPRLDPSFENHVLQLAKQGKNVILINEFLARHSSRQVEALAAFLRPHFCVRICIAYRRLYEWLPSSYNQYNKPTRYTKFSNDKMTSSSSSSSSIRLERFDLDHLGRSRNVFLDVMETQQHPTQMTRDKYARYYKDIQIMNLHALRQQQDQSSNPTALAGTATITSIADVDPLLEYFVCAAIPQASSTCQAVRQGLVHGSASRNPSVSTDCDRIGVAAFEAGWLTSSNTNKATNALRRRRYVAQQIQQHDTELRRQEQQPKATSTSSIMTMSENEPNTLADFPRECMSKDKLDLFFNLSWTVERNLFGQASTAGTVTGENNDEQFHRDFEAFALKRLCSVDTAAVLRDASWQKFLQSLNGNDGDKAR